MRLYTVKYEDKCVIGGIGELVNTVGKADQNAI